MVGHIGVETWVVVRRVAAQRVSRAAGELKAIRQQFDVDIGAY